MNDWTSGYVADIDYTYGYYTELNPSRVKLAFLSAGLVAPEIGAACELGFGQGLSTNMHAAASMCTWHGTDFNPSQASFAQELAAISGANAKLFDESFSEFANRDLPDFDYIGLHGIWSWISDENRQIIVNFIRKRLKVGGVVYISYNTLPGWSTFAPTRHLMTEHAEIMGVGGGGIVNRINGALEFTEKLIATNPLYAKQNPVVSERIKTLKEHNRNYLAHEYFNRDWHPMHFSHAAKWLESAKLSYACSAYYQDHVNAINLTTDQQNFLGEITDPVFKQTVRDFMVNQTFRRDYWVKGPRKLTPLEQANSFRKMRFLMTTQKADVDLKVNGSLGEAALSENIYFPILEFMADYKVRSISEIEQSVKAKGITFAQVIQAVLILCGKGAFNIAQSSEETKHSKVKTDKLNLHLMLKACNSHEISYLASPVTGGGVNVGLFQQLCILSIKQGKTKSEDWAAFVNQVLNAQGQRISINGTLLEKEEDNLNELIKRAKDFEAKQLPIFKALQIL